MAAGMVNHLGHRLGSLSLTDMRKVISEGGSVMYRGVVIDNIKDLPTPVQLANAAPEVKNAAKMDLEDQIRDLQRQMAALEEMQPLNPEPEPVVPGPSVRHFTAAGELTEGELQALRAQLASAPAVTPTTPAASGEANE